MRAVTHLLLVMSAFAITSIHASDFSVDAVASAVDSDVIGWRRDIHQHPELGNREFRTSKLVADQLKSFGLEDIRTGVAHTGVTAVLRGGLPGPHIALRADMDALPVTEATGLPFASKVTAEYAGQTVGVMHACGHDGHTAILLGVAKALAAHREQLRGEILFLFQPAEEGAPEGEKGGARLMLEEGVFERLKPEAVFGLHLMSSLNVGEIGYRAGPFMASADRFTIEVRGRQTHGSKPWGGVDPIVVAAELIGSAQQIVSRELDISAQPVVLSFGMIKGGIRYNIIPDSVQMEGTIRTFDAGMQQDVYRRLARIAEHTAAAHGASVDNRIPAREPTPVTVNDPALTAAMAPALEAATPGRAREIGRVMVAEDFSRYAQQVPGLFFFVGSTPTGVDPATAPSNHSPEFLVDERALGIGVRAMLNLVQRYPEWAATQNPGAPN